MRLRLALPLALSFCFATFLAIDVTGCGRSPLDNGGGTGARGTNGSGGAGGFCDTPPCNNTGGSSGSGSGGSGGTGGSCQTDNDCPRGEVCVDGQCLPVTGDCMNGCPPGSICVGGMCVTP